VTISTQMVLRVIDYWYSVRIVKYSQKTVKQQKMTIVVQIITCLHRVRRIHKAAQTPLPRETSIICAWAVATARHSWADSMCLHGRPCVWLPFAAACCYTLFYLMMMPAARLVCQRPSSNYPYFRTPLANFLISRPNFVEYGNSKTTTLLSSAKCMRPLFQGRTGCGRRPSGWHDIVTCQRLVATETLVLFADVCLRLVLFTERYPFVYLIQKQEQEQVLPEKALPAAARRSTLARVGQLYYT